jgi:hypothetical protein
MSTPGAGAEGSLPRANDAPLVCAHAALFGVVALACSISIMGDHTPEGDFSALSAIPWAHLCFVAGGSIAAAAVSRRIAFEPSPGRAFVGALLAHALAALLTAGVCAVLVPRLPPPAPPSVEYRPDPRYGQAPGAPGESP